MGSAWDLDRVEYNPRCRDIKEAVMIITYIGIFSSTIQKMLSSKISNNI